MLKFGLLSEELMLPREFFERILALDRRFDFYLALIFAIMSR